nr:ATP-binding cassette subfamily A1-like 2 [Brachionus rubens]
MFEQIKLLLKKNYTLRRRRKFRLSAEIIWPLFITVLTALVRTRVPRSNQNQCHYFERALPSGGIFPFLSNFICETNNTCYNSPRDIPQSYELRKFTKNSIEYLNQRDFLNSLSKIINYITPFNEQRQKALGVSKNITLSQSLNVSLFKQDVSSHFNLSEITFDLVLNSNPNFNLLYSSYSGNYTEPSIPSGSYDNFRRVQNLLNLLYGPSLERIDLYRLGNKVDYSVWIRNKQCGNDNELYLLKSKNQSELNKILCSLRDVDLERLFKIISSRLNFTTIKEKVYSATNFVDNTFYLRTVEILAIFERLQRELMTNPDPVKKDGINSFGDIFMNLNKLDLSRSLCGSAKTSLFERFATKLESTNKFQTLDDWLEYMDLDNVFKSNAQPLNQLTFRDTRNLLEQANNLQKSDCLFIKKKYINTLNDYEKSSKCFCKTIFKTIKILPEDLQVVFKQIKPMLFGKILYAPNNSFHSNEVIKRSNMTFKNIDNFSQVMGKAGQLTQEILNRLNLTTEQDIQIFDYKIKAFFEDFLGTKITHLNFIEIVERVKYLKEIFYFVHNFINCFEQNRFVGFKTEDEAVKMGESLMKQDLFWGMVIFNNNTNSTLVPKLIDYKIRMNASKTHDTAETKDKNYNYAPKDCPTCNPYFLYGFIYIQDIIEKGIIELKTNKTQNFGITTQMTPYPCYTADKLLIDISNSLPLFMVISWVYTAATLVKDLVYEKEKKLKEFMQIMGLSNGAYWLSWFLSNFSVMFFISVIICWVMKLGKITVYSDVSLLITFFTCFNLATISQCALISKLFNKAVLASVMGGIAYFVLFLPYLLLNNFSDTILPWQQFFASLSSTVAFGYCAEIMATLELQTKGIKWENIDSTPFATSKFTMKTLCLILLFDAFLYLVLAWYIEALYPGEYGVPKKWYFPFQKSYWFGDTVTDLEIEPTKQKKGLCQKVTDFFTKSDKLNKEDSVFKNFKPSETEENAIDKSYVDDPVGIEINDLHKIFSRGKNHALKGLTVKFYENQITSFLGHNGAGKSTTMHLLTGLYKPTYGEAKIYGLDVSKSIVQIRKSLGFVPQHNILISEFTVFEHLIFYARLKGLRINIALSEAEQMLEVTGLHIYRDQYAKKLSGGMQRMLSIAIAFIGGSKTVVLDEPTAGVDLGGRRGVWDLLFKYKKGRTIVITTHHLDEADVLSDRVAIVSNGELVSYGTPYFLKRNFGRGYYLTLAKKSIPESDEIDNSSEKTLSLDFKANRLNQVENLDEIEFEQTEKVNQESSNKQDKQINEFILSRIKNATQVETNCSEITFSIPYSIEDTKGYKQIFNEIEENMSVLGIENIGLSDTSLEEVFIRLVKQPVKNCSTETPDKKVQDVTEDQLKLYSGYTNLRVTSKICLLHQQVKALFLKRFKRTKRNVKGFLAETVLPVVFVCLALFVANCAPMIKDKPSLELHPWWFKGDNIFFISRNSSIYTEPYHFDINETNSSFNPFKPRTSSPQVNQIWKTFLQSPGPGNRCVKDHEIFVNYSSKDLYRQKSQNILTCENFDFEILWNKFETNTKELFLKELIMSNYSRTKVSKSCDCSSGFPTCSLSSGGDINLKKYYKLKTGDVLYDLTGRNVTDWLIKTEFSQSMFEKRYGGFEFLDTDKETKRFLSNWNQFTRSSFNLINSLSGLMKQNDSDLSEYQSYASKHSLYPSRYVKIWYNTKGYHANVAFLNVLNNAFLRSSLTNETNFEEHGIVAHNHPMKFSKNQFLVQLDKRILIDLFVVIFIIFALSFIPASFLVFLVEERESSSKQLQFVSGVKPYMYWMSNLLWDFINYVLTSFICLAIFVIFDTKTFTSKENFPCLVVLMILYGWSCIPLMYPFNYLFKLPGSSFVISSTVNIFVGIGTTTSTIVLNSLAKESPELANINQVLKVLFTIVSPHYCLGHGMLEMSNLHNMAEIKKNFGYRGEYSPFDFDKIGRNLLAMIIQGFCYFILIILIEYKFFYSPKAKQLNFEDTEKLEDDDVLNEKKRVLENKASENDYLRFLNLSKIYKNLISKKERLAVKNLSLGIRRGECFGLLGINGAGKSTTFKMLTGEISPTGGDVLINGNSILNEKDKAFENIGYCPQKNAIFPLLTAKEHLIFYARLRGIPEKYVNQVSQYALNRFGLNAFSDRIAQDYSGGNKRKLSTAIAILGNPTVICLDEPTSGMDAKVRRVLWNDILSLIKENRIVILTSHSMAECESLCTRLAIMVNGQFRCLGSPQHLKSKYGNGYRIVLKTNEQEKNEAILSFIQEKFTSPMIKDVHKDSVEFNIPFDGNKLSDIFGILEENRELLSVKDYSITQSTLDQIFISFSETYSKNSVEIL